MSDIASRRHRSALITGVTGQDGILLSQLLLKRSYAVWGLARPESPRLPLVERYAPGVRVLQGDVGNEGDVSKALNQAQPDEVYNLAAFSSVARSWDSATLVMETNAVALVGLLDGVRRLQDSVGKDVRVYQASSSEMFGDPAVCPQTEETAFHPRSPYGVSKSAAHLLTMNYRESYGMFCCSGILYNHESWLRPRHFVTRKVTSGAARIAAGLASHLTLGRLDVARDWGFAGDYVRAMWLMLQQDEPQDYVVATGQSHSLEEFLSLAFGHVGIDDWRTYVTHDPDLERPAEVQRLVGDATKARNRLGWSPTQSFEQIVEHMVEHDVSIARSSTPDREA